MSTDTISKKFLSNMKKLGVESRESLPFYLPVKYKDYRIPEQSIEKVMNSGSKFYIKLKLLKRPLIEKPLKGPHRAKVSLTDGRSTVNSMVFGNAIGWSSYNAGDIVHVVAGYGEFNGWPQLNNVELIPKNLQGKIVPIYKGKEKVVRPESIGENVAISLREDIKKTIAIMVEKIGASEELILKNAAREFRSLVDLFYALHRPRSYEEINKANKAVRMINAYHALLLSMNSKQSERIPESRIEYSVNDIKKQLKNIPFTLTMDQKRTIWDITKDLNSDFPMDRLVSGDVGCGKTLAYSLPAACAHLSGKNVCVMMPNLLLANQVAGEIKETFPDTDVTLMLGGKDRPKERLKKNTIVVGTTAILWWLKDINNEHKFDLLIIDEQQKLGVEQKRKLISKHTNVLEATATAIPRTAAAVLYGNKKVSLIEECPVNKEIKTTIVGSDQKREVFNKLLDITKEGSSQVAVLYPIRKHNTIHYEVFIPNSFEKNNEIKKCDLIEIIKGHEGEVLSEYSISPFENDDNWQPDSDGVVVRYRIKNTNQKKIVEDLSEFESDGIIVIGECSDDDELEKCKRSVESAAKNWEKYFPGQVVMIHGGLKTAEKIKAIDEAKNGICKVIVTSSVIEIGLTMPDLRGLLIIEAANYGASTLHQFRGRLARKGGFGEFFMAVSCPLPELEKEALDRLNLLVKYNKGSQIAEDDMRQRGFGDLSKSSLKQAGFMDGLFKGVKMTPQDIDDLLKNGLNKEEAHSEMTV